jgi:hypothetical protein
MRIKKEYISLSILLVLYAGTVLSASLTLPSDTLTRGAQALTNNWITLTAGKLEADIINNEYGPDNHCSGYNGISRLVYDGQAKTMFIPFYSGINYEHIFDEQRSGFSPRSGPMSLWRFGPQSVGLYRAAADSTWKLESMTKFTLVPPHYIDIEFTCIPRSNSFSGNYFGMFWASYINGTANSSMNFPGRYTDEPQEPPTWIAAWSPKHDVWSSHLPAWEDPSWQNLSRENWPGLAENLSPYTFSAPFFFGHKDDLIWAMMFDKSGWNPNQTIRFSQSPVGGGGKGLPAWDFHVLVRNFKVNTPYTWKARCICKPFVSNQDILKEYSVWSGDSSVQVSAARQPFVVNVAGTIKTGDNRFGSALTLTVKPKQPGSVIRYETRSDSERLWKKIDASAAQVTGPVSVSNTSVVGFRCFDRNGTPRGYAWEEQFIKIDYESDNITRGKPVSASSRKTEYPPELAVDGIVQIADLPRCWWEPDSNKGWLQVDLEKPVRLGEIQLFTYWDGGRYYQYTIDVSPDGKKWSTVVDASQATIPASKLGYRHSITPVTARYIRVNMLKNSANPGLHIVEVRAYQAENKK